MLQLGNLQVGPDGGILQVPIQRHHARGKDMAGADIACQRSENTPIQLRHRVATGGGSHDAFTGTGKIRKKGRDRETFGKVGSVRNF